MRLGKGSLYKFVLRCAKEGIPFEEGCRRYRKGYKQNHLTLLKWFRQRQSIDPRIVKVGRQWGYRWSDRIVLWNRVLDTGGGNPPGLEDCACDGTRKDTTT